MKQPPSGTSNKITSSETGTYLVPDFHAHDNFLSLNSSSFLDIRSNTSLQLDVFTVSAWFKTSKFYFQQQDPSPHHFIIDKGGLGAEGAGENLNYGIWMNDLEGIQAGFETVSGEDHFILSKDVKYNDGKWHYVVLTYDGNLLRLYLDGKIEDIKITDNAVPDSTTRNSLSIGVNSQAVNGFFIGSVDEIRIWNRPLSDEELKSLYELGIVDASGQVFYMPFG